MKKFFTVILAVVLVCICMGVTAMSCVCIDIFVPELTPEERIAAVEAQSQAVISEIEKAKNDLSDVQIIKNVLGSEENG